MRKQREKNVKTIEKNKIHKKKSTRNFIHNCKKAVF